MQAQVKTWGPFTGRQLTTIICVSIVTVLLPVAAWSATASHVIVDTPIAANVGQRSQFISSGSQRALPLNGSPLLIVKPPSGKGLVITDSKLAFYGAGGVAYAHLFVGGPTCAGEVLSQEFALPDGSGNIDSPFVPGYVIPPGKALCAHQSGTVSVTVNAYGYIVAAGDARSPLLTPPASPNAMHP